MKNCKIKKSLFIILILQACILLLAVGNYIFTKLTLSETIFTANELYCDSSFISEDKLGISDGTSAGMVASTPILPLSRGSYIVYVNYNTSSANSSVLATPTNIPAHNFQSNAASLKPGQRTASLSVCANSSGEIVLQIHYDGQGSLEISQLSLHETTDLAKQDFVYALILCGILSMGYYICVSPLNRRQTFFSLSMIILFASVPLFLDYLIAGHDLPFHLLRIDAIKIGLENHIFPVKIHPLWANGYGYATGVFYGDALLYFPALLRMLGFHIQSAYHCFVLCVNIATALVSYYCFKRLFNNNKLGLLGSMLYTLSLYRLLNVYTRAAVGEYCAMIFLPLIFLGLYRIYTHKDKPLWKLAVMPALGLTGIIQTHILTCEMVAIFILLTCLILFKRTFRPKVFSALLLTVAFTLLLNAGFLIPFADYYLNGDFIIHSAEWGNSSVQNYGLYFPQIFSIFQEGVGGTWTTVGGMSDEFNPGLGLALTLCFFVCVYFFITHSQTERKMQDFKLILISFIYSVATICMSTYLFPWDTFAQSCGLGEALISSLQFPWRFLSLGTLFLTVCSCLVIKLLSQRKKQPVHLSILPAAMILLSLSTLLGSGWYYHSFLSTGTPYRVFDTYEMYTMQLYSCEYLPSGTELNEIVEGRYWVSDGIILSSDTQEGTSILCHVDNPGADGYIEIPLTYYDGYVAINPETDTELTLSNGYNNCIRIDIPAGFNGTVDVSFREPLLWRIAEITSALSAISLLAVLLKSNATAFRKTQKTIIQ